MWAWLAKVGLDCGPSSTVCWEMVAGDELTPWARLMSWAAGEGERLIWEEREGGG